jgi:hypothetical protein
VTAKMASRKKRICSQPLGVMSELLRFQHRENQIAEHAGAHDERDQVIKAHVLPHFIRRSHTAT